MERQRTGLVIHQTKGFVKVLTDDQTSVLCKWKGSLFHKDASASNTAANTAGNTADNLDQIVVGDKVHFLEPLEGDLAQIIGLVPRRSVFKRRKFDIKRPQVLAANVDLAFIVSSLEAPPVRPSLIARFMVACTMGRIQPVLVFTKADLADQKELAQLVQRFHTIDLAAFGVSIYQKESFLPLKKLLQGKMVLFIGQSGVGKSSLLNAFLPEQLIKTGAINQKTQKGTHTTTLASIYPLEGGGNVIDSPGIRNFALCYDALSELGENFLPFYAVEDACWAKNCLHDEEPRCAVKQAVQDGVVDAWFYDAYKKFLLQEKEEEAKRTQRARR